MPKLKNGVSLTNARIQAAGRQVIRPFVCSTFKDFHIERDFLQEEIFPKLNRLCRERGTSFLPVDLRWNKNQSQQNSEHVLRLCLDSIGRCAPFFICLLGDRYGVHRSTEAEAKDRATEEWLDRNFETAAACGYEWVLEEENRYNSITELEIVQASFRKKYDYGYFYFRTSSHIEEKLKGVEPCQRDSVLFTYKTESEYAARKLRELKQQTIDTELPVRHFSTLEELGELVIKDWMAVIDLLYPPIDPIIFASTESEVFRQWSAHEAFAMARRQVFIRTPRIREMTEVLNLHAEVEQGIRRKTSMVMPTAAMATFMTSLPGSEKESLPPVLVLAGESGCGKSTLAAYWLNQFTSSHPQVVTIPHFIGCDSASSDVATFMRRCTSELRLQYLGTDFDDFIDNKDLIDITRVTEAFRAAISLGPSVIVLDGANELGQSLEEPAFKVKEMDWLPSTVPLFCRIIITTSKSDITYRALSQRRDAYCIDIPRLFDVRGKNDLLKEYTGSNCKFLDAARLSKITASKLAHLPSFYVALAGELRVLGAHKNADRMLDSYVHASTLFDLWSLIFRRWTHDYGWLRPAVSRSPVPAIKAQVSRDRMNSGWVADALRLIALSRDGLTENEVLGALEVMGYLKNYEVTMAHWEMLRLIAEHALIEMPSGLVTFSHPCSRGAVEIALLGNLTSPSQERTVSPFHETWERLKQQGHTVLSSYFSKQAPTARKVDELPWQLNMSGNMDGLGKTLYEPRLFVKLASNRDERRKKIDLLSYWAVLKQKGLKPEEALFQMAVKTSEKPNSEANKSIPDREVDSATSKTEELSAIDELCRKDNDESFSQVEVALIHFFAGKFLAEDEQFNMAEHLLLSAYKMAYPVVSVKDVHLMCDIQEALGNLYLKLSEPSKSVMWFSGALKSAGEMTRVPDKVGHTAMIGRLLYHVAFCQLPNHVSLPPEVQSRSRASSRVGRVKTPISGKDRADNVNTENVGAILDEALRHMKLAGVFPGRSSVYFHMGLLAIRQRRREDAEPLFREALKMRKDWYGTLHPLVAEIYDALASLLCLDPGDSPDSTPAEDMFRKALHMREAMMGPSDLLVANTLFNLGKLLQAKGKKDSTREAKQLFQRALDIRSARLGVYHPSTKTIRRALMSLETVDLGAKFTGKSAGKAQELLALEGLRSRSLTKTSLRNLDFRQTSV